MPKILLELIIFMVKAQHKKGTLFPFIRSLAEDVIVNKSVNHKEAPNKMEKAIKTAEYFREFEVVLKKVLADWGVKHE